MSDNIVIVAAARTAVGSFGGSLSSLPATELGVTVLKALLERTGVQPGQIDEVILGQVLTAGTGQNPARQTVIKAGLPHTVPAMTINKVCGSGLKAVHLAMQAVACGDAEIVIAGGQESMSQSPHALPRSREGQRMGDWKMVDTMLVDGLIDAFHQIHMGVTAENIAKKYAFGREAQDAFAAASQQKAEAAIKSGRFADEIVPVSIPQRKGDPVVFAQDEFPRAGTTAETLGKLRPAFDKEGTVTAGNASGLNDGAAMVMVMKESKAKDLGLDPHGASGRLLLGGGGPGHHGDRPHPGLHGLPQEGRLDPRGPGPDRGQRGLRRPGHVREPGDGLGPQQGERERRSHRHRPSHRRLRCPGLGDPAARDAASATPSGGSPPCASAAVRAWPWRWSVRK